jgi:hypothetical protein
MDSLYFGILSAVGNNQGKWNYLAQKKGVECVCNNWELHSVTLSVGFSPRNINTKELYGQCISKDRMFGTMSKYVQLVPRIKYQLEFTSDMAEGQSQRTLKILK